MPGSNELIVFVICLLLCLCVVGSARSVSNTVHLTPQHQHNTNPVQTIGQQPIDESFYSRQLFVYGKSAQEKMSQGTVLVVGQGLLIDEVVKNLALTGVGHLLLAETSSTDPARLSIRGNESSLLSYVKSLNPRVKVENWTVDAILGGECLSTRPVDVIIVCDSNLHLWKEINHLSRRHNVKMVGCQSLGLMGVLFNDFLEGFEVEDLDGESYPEVS